MSGEADAGETFQLLRGGNDPWPAIWSLELNNEDTHLFESRARPHPPHVCATTFVIKTDAASHLTAMSSQTSFGSSMLFQTINDDLNASLATADELSKEFSSLLNEASSKNKPETQTSSPGSRKKTPSTSPRVSSPQRTSSPGSRKKTPSTSPRVSSPQRAGSNGSSSSQSFSPNSTTYYSSDSIISSTKNVSSSPDFTTSPLSSPKIRRNTHSPLPGGGSDSYLYGQYSPQQAPRSPRRNSPSHMNLSPRGLSSPSLSPTNLSFSQSSHSATFHPSPNLLNPYDNTQMGRRSPRPDRSPSPLSMNHPMSSTLPRNFGFREPDGVQQQQRSPSKWNETDLDVSYEKKPHHTYDKTEWVRPTVPNSAWRESDLDGPPPTPTPKKDPRSKALQFSHSSLPRNARISAPPEVSSPSHSPYTLQPIISRISIPPASTRSRQHRPIPLSVIMRLQNPHWGAMSTRHPRVGGESDMAAYQPAAPMPREFFKQPIFQPKRHPPELRQPALYSDVLSSGDVDAELERLDPAQNMPVILENPFIQSEQAVTPAPRPLSPTRLQPVVAPEAQSQEIPDIEELLRIRAEIPRALKRRGSMDQSQPLKKASHYQPNQYKHLIDKLFRKNERRPKGDQSSDSSSSDGEDCAMPPSPAPKKSTMIPQEVRSYNSILRRPKQERKSSGKRARLSPHVLALDGALVGELETVQKAVQEMIDPSYPNDEGITALHNAICGGHYNIVDFLVRIGANVSAPDSHGWTPLHCAASCNDRHLCEFLVRNGAAVMAMTESDGATASQKCDPYAVAFDDCENFLRGVEEAMGVENSGVLYALWNYPAQAPDELSFKDGDMVTILQKPEGSDWWWASLCGREGFVPNNYFGLFPKVRPKTLC